MRRRLIDGRIHLIVLDVQPQARPPVFSPRVLFLIATIFGVSSTIQAAFLDRAHMGDWDWLGWLHLALLNLWYWYVPALLAPLVMRVARRFPLESTPVWQQAGVHVLGVLTYGLTHTVAMAGARSAMDTLSSHTMMKAGFWTFTTTEYVRQFDWMMMTYLFLVGLAHALDYRGQSERHALASSQLETRLVEARLQALQRQLHPHFLFNTLNTIAALIRSNAPAADRMIEQLGALLRLTLRVGDRPVVSLEMELEALRTYLAIEQTRLGTRLQVRLAIADEALHAEVPSLLLQPLVENAIRHGVAPHSRQGWVEVQAVRAGSRLRVTVRDSGDGVDEGSLSAAAGGVGLSNTRARLEHLYPGDHKLALGTTADGFAVTVDLPFQLARPVAADARTGGRAGAA
ncbi:MAG: sensor histidine kinase [Vicinamibacterales bacterium]